MGKLSRTTDISNSTRATRPLRDRLTDGLGDDLMIFGMMVFGCLMLLVWSVPGYFGAASVARQAQNDLETLPTASARLPAGTRAVLSGVVANTNAAKFHQFVGYVEESYNSGGRHARRGWEHEATFAHPFTVTTSDGDMHIANNTYTFSPLVPWLGNALIAHWDHQGTDVEMPPGTWERAQRYRGLVADGPVTAVGVVMADGTFQADFVVGMSVDDARAAIAPLANGETSSLLLWFIGAGMVGLALTLLMFLKARVAAYHAPAEEDDPPVEPQPSRQRINKRRPKSSRRHRGRSKTARQSD